MLSFDITDRNIRIIKGTESNGKIKISAAAEIELDEAVIVNGHVNDINRVAVMINQVLKSKNMPDKEAIVAISSNQTVFKELMIPPNPKESEFMKSIRQELQVQINVDDSYSVAYVIVGEPEAQTEGGERLQRILVTACPYDVVECYKRIFHMLGITLKTVMIGCNAITKVLLADVKTKTKMPLLAVQIDANFISLNLYENSQLSFSRFASIDPEDYDNPDDYVFEAVNENIFRMLQFARSRGSENIENVVFYGDLNASPNLYNRLIDELASNDLNVSQLNVPPQIHGYQNLEFAVYANAIGAMFKRNRVTEHINLLETDNAGAAAKSKAGKSFVLPAVLGIGLSALAVIGVFAGLLIADGIVKAQTQEYRNKIESPETAAKIAQYENLLVVKDNVTLYANEIQTAADAYNSKPILLRDAFEAVDNALVAVAEDMDGVEEGGRVDTMTYTEGVLTFPIVAETTDEFSQKYPAALVQYLYEHESDKFISITYNGYDVTAVEDERGEGTRYVSFDLEVMLDSNQLPDIAAAIAEQQAAAASEEAVASDQPAEAAE
ncbi:MAG: pilus assembly protein PilM [Oscillospiraceae bacterium]|nr:pilus assembly protein PilM [Oscillospiraceae bacterium]